MSQKTLLLVSVVVAVVATLLPDMFAYYGLALVLLGLVMGIANPIEDVATRVAIYVLAVLLPAIADAGGDPARGTPNDGVLMDIPYLGEFVVGFLGNLATVIAGVAIASFFLVLITGLMAAGDDSDDGAAAPEVAEPEVAAPEVAEPEVAEPEVAAPEVAEPEVAEPEVAEPEVAAPEVAAPEVAEPEVAEPEAPSWGGDDSAGSDSDDGDDEDRGY